MADQERGYKSVGISFYQDTLDCTLDGRLTSDGWQFSLWHKKNQDFIFSDINLQQLQELILLGRMTKGELMQKSEEKVCH